MHVRDAWEVAGDSLAKIPRRNGGSIRPATAQILTKASGARRSYSQPAGLEPGTPLRTDRLVANHGSTGTAGRADP